MTLVYARMAECTVANEYFAVSEKVEALYDQPKALPADAEGREMAKLRRQMHQRMLGNGYCARPVELDCRFETICETCTSTSSAGPRPDSSPPRSPGWAHRPRGAGVPYGPATDADQRVTRIAR